MIERFGRFSRVATPGLHVVIPFLEKIAYAQSLKESVIEIAPQHAITKDNVSVSLNGNVYYKIFDSKMASYAIEDFAQAITKLAQSAMRKEVGKLDLDELFHNREGLNARIITSISETTESWGIHVYRYEIADIMTDDATSEAMHKQSSAERQKRAQILESEGYREMKTNQSEGKKRESINRALGEAESVRLMAEADAKKLRCKLRPKPNRFA
eukprot:TRINITY_DN2111_c0_g1_i1.p1 TRINITY_DN2111_c0_g1~~TRINITY_DN2111_c0_g1_i1.p1  ORF type:complete len:213 (-),score=46.79 TRINITY_DN2111_c0_g1_i1:320-958(-)